MDEAQTTGSALFNYTVPCLKNTVLGYVSAYRGKRINVRVGAYHRSRIENAVASDFNVVSEHCSEFFESAFDFCVPAAYRGAQKRACQAGSKDGRGNQGGRS